MGKSFFSFLLSNSFLLLLHFKLQICPLFGTWPQTQCELAIGIMCGFICSSISFYELLDRTMNHRNTNWIKENWKNDFVHQVWELKLRIGWIKRSIEVNPTQKRLYNMLRFQITLFTKFGSSNCKLSLFFCNKPYFKLPIWVQICFGRSSWPWS